MSPYQEEYQPAPYGFHANIYNDLQSSSSAAAFYNYIVVGPSDGLGNFQYDGVYYDYQAGAQPILISQAWEPGASAPDNDETLEMDLQNAGTCNSESGLEFGIGSDNYIYRLTGGSWNWYQWTSAYYPNRTQGISENSPYSGNYVSQYDDWTASGG